jgi:hypothetical protein
VETGCVSSTKILLAWLIVMEAIDRDAGSEEVISAQVGVAAVALLDMKKRWSDVAMETYIGVRWTDCHDVDLVG